MEGKSPSHETASAHLATAAMTSGVLFGKDRRWLSIYWIQMEEDKNSLLSTQPELTNDHSPT